MLRRTRPCAPDNQTTAPAPLPPGDIPGAPGTRKRGAGRQEGGLPSLTRPSLDAHPEVALLGPGEGADRLPGGREAAARGPGATGRRGPEARPYRSSVPEPLLSRPARGALLPRAGDAQTLPVNEAAAPAKGGVAVGPHDPPPTAGKVHKSPGCLGRNGRLFYLSSSAPTAAATAILGSHCGGRSGAGGLQRGHRAGRHAPSPRQRPRGGENSLGREPQCDQRARLESCDPPESVVSLLPL